MFLSNSNRKEVVSKNPASAKIVKVCGGYLVFESIDAYKTWKAQK